MLVAEPFLLFDSESPWGTDEVGPECFAVEREFNVADAGMRGVGMLSCFRPCALSTTSCGGTMAPFELPFFQDKLSFLLSVLIEDGV
jgi:hypothetical protein